MIIASLATIDSSRKLKENACALSVTAARNDENESSEE